MCIRDRPTGNLDPATSLDIVQLLRRIHDSGTTIVMATHDNVIVDEMRKRVVELEDGVAVRDEESGTYVPKVVDSRDREERAAERADGRGEGGRPVPDEPPPGEVRATEAWHDEVEDVLQ